MDEIINSSAYSFIRYLASKKTVDDRALNKDVWKSLVSEVQTSFKDQKLRILELGAGIGTMVERLFEWDFFPVFEYTALDVEPGNINYAIERISKWSSDHNFSIEQTSQTSRILENSNFFASLEYNVNDIYHFLEANQGIRAWDLVIAHALLDLIDIPRTLHLVRKIADKRALFYFTLNFDGITSFQPEMNDVSEDLILNQYHRTMDERFISGAPSGGSHSGRHLFNYLHQASYQILDAGASDWVVFPVSGAYLHDEAYFLHFIINTIQEAVSDTLSLETRQLQSWLNARHSQVDRGELTYIAHQIDFFGRIFP